MEVTPKPKLLKEATLMEIMDELNNREFFDSFVMITASKKLGETEVEMYIAYNCNLTAAMLCQKAAEDLKGDLPSFCPEEEEEEREPWEDED